MSIVQALMGSISGGSSGGGGGGGGFNGPPQPGSGNYLTSWAGSEGWGIQGAAYDPGAGIANIPDPTWGWRRTTEQGYWCPIGQTANSNPGIFNAGNFGSYDNYGGFGQIDVSDTYCCEWKGYLQAPGTDTYNFLLDSDDVAMFWIGDGALYPESVNPVCIGNNSSGLNVNSVGLTGGIWYPIRMRYQEWSGAERCQVFFGPVNSANPLYAMSQWQQNMGWNETGLGY